MSYASTVPIPAAPAPVPPRSAPWLIHARRAGLLTLLTAKEWQLLCAVLSFTDRDGRRRFSREQLAAAIGVAAPMIETRLAALANRSFQGEPLLHPDTDPDGELIGATLANHPLFAGEPPEAVPARRANDGIGTDPSSSSADDLAAELTAVGLTAAQIDWLLHRYPETRIRWQLAWLPERRPRNPAAMLVRAICDDWPPPQHFEPTPPIGENSGQPGPMAADQEAQ